MRVPLLVLLVGALAAPGWAQQPALPGAPQPAQAPASDAAVPPTVPAEAPPGAARAEVVGQAYGVEMRSGTNFLGVLRASTPQSITFDTQELGTVTVQRADVRQFTALTPEQAQRGYDDVGNGDRLLYGPTARNLRRGEGHVQLAEIFLLNADYGITDNFSLGAMFTYFPNAGNGNFVALMPKLSFPVGAKVSLGGGALLGLSRSNSFGIVYANGTYGSADHNLTLGFGYSYSGGSSANTPALQVGGATRISRRVSLVNETYVYHQGDSNFNSTNLFGVAGVRIAAHRLSVSLGLLYNYYRDEYTSYGSNSYDSFDAIPYGEISYRFGKVR